MEVFFINSAFSYAILPLNIITDEKYKVLSSDEKILYVLHSGVTGGTFLTNKDLMKQVASDFEVLLLGAENDFFRVYKYADNELSVIKDKNFSKLVTNSCF